MFVILLKIKNYVPHDDIANLKQCFLILYIYICIMYALCRALYEFLNRKLIDALNKLRKLNL